MHIGLINCDPLTPEVRKQYGDYPTMFADLFSLVTNEINWSVFDATQLQLPSRIKACDVYLITGSRYGVQDKEPWMLSLISFVQTLWQKQIKTLGICFGHQIMAHAMGGQVNRAPTGWGLGVAETFVTDQRQWMRPRQNKFNIYVSHQDQVLTLPPQGYCLAHSSHCPNAIIQYEHNFLSFQGHPEFNKNYANFLIKKRRELFSPPTYNRFIHSLVQEVDTKLLANWMIHFLDSKQYP